MSVGKNIAGIPRELQEPVGQWYHFPMILSQGFTVCAVHFLAFKWVIVGAIAIQFVFSILKYVYISKYELFYLTIGHSVILYGVAIGDLVYFIYKGNWPIGIYVIAYVPFLCMIPGLLTMFTVDIAAGKILGIDPRQYAAFIFLDKLKRNV